MNIACLGNTLTLMAQLIPYQNKSQRFHIEPNVGEIQLDVPWEPRCRLAWVQGPASWWGYREDLSLRSRVSAPWTERTPAVGYTALTTQRWGYRRRRSEVVPSAASTPSGPGNQVDSYFNNRMPKVDFYENDWVLYIFKQNNACYKC